MERLNEKIRPYLLRRQKNDVERSLVPLEETIIWVEMTLFQKKCYRAVLEGNRELNLDGCSFASPSRPAPRGRLRAGLDPEEADGLGASAAAAAADDGGGGALGEMCKIPVDEFDIETPAGRCELGATRPESRGG